MQSFSGTCLSVARQLKGFTQKELADQLGLVQQTISNYESGLFRPELPLVTEIARLTEFPINFFYSSDIGELEADAVSFRSKRSLTQEVKDRSISVGRLTWDRISTEFRNRFELPEISIPDLAGEDPETAAQLLRDEWRLGQAPILNMVHLLESRGVEVFWFKEDSPSVDALSFWRNHRPYVLIDARKNDREKAGERGRMDAAHELAHLVLHQKVDDITKEEIEKQADEFAGAFLLPERQFLEECPRTTAITSFLPLKERWKVSIAAMVVRCKRLRVYNDAQYQSAYKAISYYKWRKEEPNRLKLEESRLHHKIFKGLEADGEMPEDFASAINLNEKWLYSFVPVAQKFSVKPAESPRVKSIEKNGLSLQLHWTE